MAVAVIVGVFVVVTQIEHSGNTAGHTQGSQEQHGLHDAVGGKNHGGQAQNGADDIQDGHGLLLGQAHVDQAVVDVTAVGGHGGLAVGVSGISTATMLVIALLLGEESVAVILAALLGACLGFIPYNFNPAQIFMGDTGSTFLGFILASLSIQGLFKMYAVISFMVPFLILGVPFFDVSFAVIRRLAKGQNPMTADRGHIHHRLIDMGLSQKQSVATVYMLTGVLGLAAVLLANTTETKAFILFAAVLVVAILGFAVIFGPHHRPPQNDKKDEEKENG